MKGIFDYSQFESTGNIAVDMVASCVGFYRQRRRPLKTIYLNRSYYEKLRDFVRSKVPEDQHDAKLEFDGVSIERSDIINGLKTLHVDFYPIVSPATA